MEIAEKVYNYLDGLGIEYKKHEHPAVRTVEEAQLYWKGIDGAQCKNLFLRDQKGKRHYLVVVEENKKVDMSKLAEQLGEKKLSFASEQRLDKYLKLKPGAVSPFGLINDEENLVELKIDKDLKKEKKISFHPNINTVTLELAYSDFEKYLKASGNDYEYIAI